MAYKYFNGLPYLAREKYRLKGDAQRAAMRLRHSGHLARIVRISSDFWQIYSRPT